MKKTSFYFFYIMNNFAYKKVTKNMTKRSLIDNKFIKNFLTQTSKSVQGFRRYSTSKLGKFPFSAKLAVLRYFILCLILRMQYLRKHITDLDAVFTCGHKTFFKHFFNGNLPIWVIGAIGPHFIANGLTFFFMKTT